MIPAWGALAGIAVLILLALLLSLIDVAFDYVSKIAMRAYREESWKTEYLSRCLDDPMSLLLPLRMGLQGSLIAITVLVTSLYMTAEIPQPLLLAFVTMLALFLVFRETLPNIIARKNPERLLLFLLPAFRVYAKALTPITVPLYGLVGVFIDEREDDEEEATEEEVQAFIETGEDEGILDGDEGRMVQSILDLGDKVVREVMTPRPEMVAISQEASFGELCALFTEEKVSRIPVYKDKLDTIVGLIYAIDVVGFLDTQVTASVEPLIREVSFVPETKRVAELLREFQRSSQTFAMVVDEYGGISGLVTVEDILEEIVGEIYDEFDEVDHEIVREHEGVFLVSGRADIDDVKEELRLTVNGSGFDTVSGYVLDAIGRIPQTGEVIDHQGIRIEVVDAEGQRINKVRFRIPSESSAK